MSQTTEQSYKYTVIVMLHKPEYVEESYYFWAGYSPTNFQGPTPLTTLAYAKRYFIIMKYTDTKL